jgi:Haem-NO-binding
LRESLHGIIHLQLKRYLETRLGQAKWLKLLEEAGACTTLPYVHLGEYPDEELGAIVAAAARATATSAETVLEGFGEFIAASLIVTYRRLIAPEWRTLDVLANTEQTIHQVVRRQNPGARPPLLRCARPTPDEVIVTYSSVRRLCILARGIIRGIAGHYGDRLEITEATCMHQGAAACILAVRKLGPDR